MVKLYREGCIKMDQGNHLAQKLRWLRREQSITLQHLSERCGRAVSYLCQLEGGARVNPTRQTLEVLAQALGVRPAFLFSEAPAAGAAAEVDPAVISRQYSRHLAAMPRAERDRLTRATPARRFASVVRFLIDQFPESFTPIELAYAIGVSPRALQDWLTDQVDLSHHAMEQLSRLSGVPVAFFAFGTLAQAAEPLVDMADLLRYLEPLKLAMANNFTPEKLSALIRAAGGL